MDTQSPEFSAALEKARAGLEAAVSAFELETGRVVSGICLEALEVTGLRDSDREFVRGRCWLSWNRTEAEVAEEARLDESWRLYLVGQGPKP